MRKPLAARYRTTNWSACNAALRKRGSLLIWLDKAMIWHAPRDGGRGRPPVFSNAAIRFCLTIKVLFKLPLRQTAGMVASLLRPAGLDWPVPDDSTLCRRQKTLAVRIPYDTRRCHAAIIEREATAIIPIRKNGRPWKENARLQWPATTFSGPPGTTVGTSGSAGPDTTRAAGSRRPRPPDRRNPYPHRTHEPLLGTWHRRNCSCGPTHSGKGEITPQAASLQQRHGLMPPARLRGDRGERRRGSCRSSV